MERQCGSGFAFGLLWRAGEAVLPPREKAMRKGNSIPEANRKGEREGERERERERERGGEGYL